ncbi:PREDICTED: mucin-5AC-like [Priapulus caudatus]|uniref:Mucin-5AC-like n=1 Tax=Priapulus caudatus TaxID=37621 RepID=A0ABM1DN69_PRICU|nr:PREDICTED: mucin-5AC-like [Priapulus caudatus]
MLAGGDGAAGGGEVTGRSLSRRTSNAGIRVGEETSSQQCSGSWKSPDNAYNATWEYDDIRDRVKFTISTANLDRWVGIGFSKDKYMPATDVAYGWVNTDTEARLFDGWISVKAHPRTSEHNDLQMVTFSKKDGRHTLSFWKPRVAREPEDLTLDDVYLMFPAKPGLYNADYSRIFKHLAQPIIGPKVYFGACATSSVGESLQSVARSQTTDVVARRKDPEVVPRKVPDADVVALRATKVASPRRVTDDADVVSRRFLQEATERQLQRAVSEVTDTKQDSQDPFALKLNTPQLIQVQGARTSSTSRQSNERSSSSSQRSATGHDACSGSWIADDGSYTATWDYVPATDRVRFSVSVNTLTGWIGLGFSNNRFMPFTDLAYGWINEQNEAKLIDGWLYTYSVPRSGEQQDLELISASRSGNRQTIEFTKPRLGGQDDLDLAGVYLVFPTKPGPYDASSESVSKHHEPPVIGPKVDFTSCVQTQVARASNTRASARALGTRAGGSTYTSRRDNILLSKSGGSQHSSRDSIFRESLPFETPPTRATRRPPIRATPRPTTGGSSYRESLPFETPPTRATPRPTTRATPRPTTRGSTYRESLPVETPSTRPTPGPIAAPVDFGSRPVTGVAQRIGSTRRSHQRISRRPLPATRRRPRTRTPRPTDPTTVYTTDATTTEIPTEPTTEVTTAPPTRRPFRRRQSLVAHQQRLQRISAGRRRPRPVPTRTGRPQPPPTTTTTTRPTTTTEAPVVRPTTPAFEPPGPRNFAASCEGYWSYPEACPASQCDYAIHWIYEALQDRVKFTITVPQGKWVSVGFSKNGRMKDTDIAFGWVTPDGLARLFDGFLTGYRPPVVAESNDLQFDEARLANGVQTLIFWKPRTGLINDLTLNGVHLVFPHKPGTYDTSKPELPTISKHEQTPVVGPKVNFRTCRLDLSRIQSQPRVRAPATRPTPIVRQALDRSGKDSEPLNSRLTPTRSQQQRTGSAATTSQQRLEQSTVARGTGQQQSGQTTLTQVGGQQRFGQTTSGSGTGQQRFGQSTTARGTGQQQSGQTTLTQAGGQQRFGQTTSGRGIGQQRFGQSTSIGGIDQQRFGQSTASRTGQQQFGQNTNGRGIAQRQSFSTQTSGQRLVPSTSAQVRSQQQFSSTQLASRPQSGQRQGSLSITSSSSRPLPSFSTLARPAPNRGLSLGQRQSILNTNRATNNVPRATTPRPGSTTKGSLLFLGELRNFSPSGIRGKIYGIDRKQIGLSGFVFDPFRESCRDPVFYIGVHDHRSELLANQKSGAIQQCPGEFGIQVPDENKSLQPLRRRYNGQNIVLLLPDGVETIQLQWLSLWCRSTNTDLASAVFPGEALRPVPPEGVTSLQGDGVSSTELATLNASTVGIAGLRYNRKYESTFFVVGKSGGETPTKENIVSIVPDENGELDTNGIGPYNGDKIVILDLPAGLTWLDVDYFAIFTYKQCNPKPLVWLRIKVEE